MAASPAPPKTVLVTGCSDGGLGAALALAFARENFRVFATARDPARVTAAGSHANIEVLRLDVTSAESIAACAAEVSGRTGGRGLDVLVNNAGAIFVLPLLDTAVADARRLFEVNVWGMLAVTQAFAPLLITAKGTVLNISSLAGAAKMAWQGVYNSSKAAMTFLSETLRIELRPLGVRVVTAMVGEVETTLYAGTAATESFSLPAGSHYKQVEAVIGRQARGELQTSNERAEITAGNIVRDVLSGTNGPIWRGGVAGFAKYATWLMPARLFEWILHKDRGVYDLNRG
ncbi:hypothetical protein B0T24DRAFT_618253 [Lasiosphaeria ovina]|uniref:Uncharacterized protein n=1 Tax=Lasiosphaeria ovina TaxID=92902 RepID=A0AAE0KI28_9PEZI|nr:hypothetical protein B0T24DRAFT_618253 [Lasiosphaeria ovina]